MASRTATKRRPQIVFRTADGKEVPYLPPQNDEQVRQWCDLFFGLRMADRDPCPGHTTPLQAICDAYFARTPLSAWVGSRGLSGKSTGLAALSILELLAGMNVVVLGGSAKQSKRVHELESEIWKHEIQTPNGPVLGPLNYFLAEEPTGWYTKTIYNNTLVAITASQTSVRGPHPNRLRIDEADELNIGILDAALGQPITTPEIASQVVISSTHQYPDGTMTEVLRRAEERGFPVYRWCYKDTVEAKGGWLTQQALADTRARITDSVWEIEYELGQPSIEGRQFSDETIARIFDPNTDEIADEVGPRYVFEEPRRGASYATGCDWGKEQDFTSISTWRYDVVPARLVAYERAIKEDWPLMAKRFEDRCAMYPNGTNVHDAKGLGAVLHDYSTVHAFPYQSQGKQRNQLYGDYIIGADRGLFLMPRVRSLVNAHRYVTYKMIYGSGHVPDCICGNALGWAGVLGHVEDLSGQAKRPVRVGRLLGFG